MSSRRGKGEGSIKKRADGRWEARLELGWRDGKRRRKYICAKTRQEVQQRLSKARRQLEEQGTLGDERQTVEAFLNRWLAHMEPRGMEPRVRPRTYADYEGVVNNHLIPALGKTRLVKLTVKEVQEMLDQKAGKFSPRTVAKIRGVLRQALNDAVTWGDLPRNPAVAAKPPRQHKYRINPFTKEEAGKFLEAARGERLEALYTTVLALGLRRGEALGLKWKDIDLDEGFLTVRRALQRQKGKGLVFVEPKSESSRRTVALPGFVVESLKEHRNRQVEERLKAGPEWEDHDLVFPSERGTPLAPDNLHRSFHRILETAKLRRVRFHDLRHAAATFLLAQGLPPRVIMETLGHSQISLTMNTYAHVSAELQRGAADAMDDLLGGK